KVKKEKPVDEKEEEVEEDEWKGISGNESESTVEGATQTQEKASKGTTSTAAAQTESTTSTTTEEPVKTFKELVTIPSISSSGCAPPQLTMFQGVMDELCAACEKLGYKSPTPIQRESIPV